MSTTTHTEWRVESETLEDEFDTRETEAREWARRCRNNPDWEPVTLMRRTVTTIVSDWEPAEDTAGGEQP